MSFERLLERADAFGSFNRRVLVAVLALVVTVVIGSGVFLSLPAAQAQGNAPIPIRTVAELRAIADTRESLDGHYILMNDIDLLEFDADGETVSWTPIGGRGIYRSQTIDSAGENIITSQSGRNTNLPFTGVFDGGGYEIRNLWADTQNDCWVGLFGHVIGGSETFLNAFDSGAPEVRNYEGIVRNVGLRDVYVSSQDHTSLCLAGQSYAAGGLVAVLQNGRVESSYVVGGTVKTSLNQSLHLGGLVGNMVGADSTVVNSFTDVMVDGGSSSSVRVGGLVGNADALTVIWVSYTLGDVSGGSRVGLLVGNSGGITVRNSFATGTRAGAEGTLFGLGSVSGGGNYRTTGRTGGNHIPLADLKAATTATGAQPDEEEFRFWNVPTYNCPAEAAVGAGEPAWDFGTENELPVSNCIAEGVQRGLTPVRTAAQLRAIADDLGGDYFLRNNIDLAQASWTPLGSSGGGGFSGTFDGGGFEISNLMATTATASCEVGLFGHLAVGGTVRNVGLRDVDVSGDGVVNGDGTACDSIETITNYGMGAFVGALVGYSSGDVEASYVVGGTVRGGGSTGGLVGVIDATGLIDATITGSFADVGVEGLGASGAVGGLLGRSISGAVMSSYALGDVSGSGATLGGLVGSNATSSISGAVRNSYATGNVASGGGGLVGSTPQGTRVESYQTSDSAGMNYRSLLDFAPATTATGGFGTWDDDMCSDDAVAGAGGTVWDFGEVNELPRINCIRALAQPAVTVPLRAITVATVGGVRTFSETAAEVDLLVTAGVSGGGDVTVNLTPSSGDLVEGVDYTLSSDTVTFPAGMTILRQMVTLTLINDELEEELLRTLSIGYDITTTETSVIVVVEGSPLELEIMDDDTPEITLDVSGGTGSFRAMEGDDVVVTVRASKTLRNPIDLTVSDGTSSATVGDDYTLSSRMVTLAPSGEATVMVDVLTDEIDEVNELVSLLFAITDAGNSRANLASGTVVLKVEDANVPELSFSTTALSLTEGGSDVMFTVESDIAVATDVGVMVSVSSGDANEFTINPPALVTIQAGETVSEVVTLTSLDDSMAEAPETVVLRLILSSGDATLPLPADDLVVTVIDDDAPTVLVSVASGGGATTVTEGEIVTLDVTLSLGLMESSVEVILSPTGLALDEYDFSRTSVTFAAGTSVLSQTVILTLIDDDVEEELSRTLSIPYTVTPSADVELGSPLVLTVMDDDAPVIQVTSGRTSLAEGRQTTVTFRADKTPVNPVTIFTGISDADGDGNADLAAVSPALPASFASVTLQAGQLQQTRTFLALNDNLDELDEMIVLTFVLDTGASSRATLVPGSSNLAITVVDTDVPVVSVGVLGASESGVITLTFEVDITPITPLVLAVGFGTGGSAVAGEDYGSISSSTVTLTEGGEAGRQTRTVALIDDDDVEATETIEFVVSLMSGEATIGNAGATRLEVEGEVLDNDAPNLTVTVTSAELVEGAEVSTVTLTPDAVLPFDLTVRIGFGGGTASGDEVEFERSVILAAGEPSVSFTVRALSDLEDEPEDETLLLVFMAYVMGRAAVFADGEGALITGDAPLEFTVVNVPPPSTGLVLPEFTRVVLSAVGGSVGGSLRARLDYEVGGGALYPTSVGWRVLSGSDVFTLGTPITRDLSDGSYEFSVEVIFEAVGTGEIEVFVRQIGAPTEELREIGTVTSIAPQPSAAPAPFVPPADPPGVAPVGSVRPSVGGDVVMELPSGDEVAVEIPAGASNDFLRVEVADVPSSALNSLPSLPSGVAILTVAPVLDIDLMDSNNAEVRRVNRPTRVCLPLSEADYGRVENPALLRVITYHEGAANWDVLNAVYDVGTEQLCAYTSRFSVFAIGLASPQVVLNEIFLPSTGDGGVLGLWGVAGLAVFGSVLILAGVLVVVRRKFPNSRSARS